MSQSEIPELVYCILSTHPDTGEKILGKSGRQLIEFINKVDLKHPDLSNFLQTLFPHNMLEIQEVLELAENYKHLSISKNFYKLVRRKKFSKDLFANRLLKSSKDRELIRKQRSIQTIYLKEVAEVWNRSTDNFEPFQRNNVPYIAELELSEKIALRYLELGCTNLQEQAIKEVKRLRSNLTDRYYGFNRLTMTTAAIILAKTHQCKLKTYWDFNSQLASITAPAIVEDNAQFGEYEPRLYPLHELDVPEKIADLVVYLDNYPDIDNKALFDDFLVLVPSVKLLKEALNDVVYINDKKGDVFGFNKQINAVKFLDSMLINDFGFNPILLGERDGKVYFISNWN